MTKKSKSMRLRMPALIGQVDPEWSSNVETIGDLEVGICTAVH